MSHINKYIDFVTDVFIVHKDKVLLTFHKRTREWLPIGGHVGPNEDPLEALKREIKEESGLTDIKFISKVKYPKIKSGKKSWQFKFLEVPHFMDIHYCGGVHRHVDLRYVAISDTDQVKHKEDESGGLKWFSIQDLDSPKYNLIPFIKYYAKKSIEIANGIQN